MIVKISIKELEYLAKQARESQAYRNGEDFVFIESWGDHIVFSQPCVYRECNGEVLGRYLEHKEIII